MPVSTRSPLTRLTSDPRSIRISNATNAAFSKLNQVRTQQHRILASGVLLRARNVKSSRTCLYFFSEQTPLRGHILSDCNTYVLVSVEAGESEYGTPICATGIVAEYSSEHRSLTEHDS